MQHIIKFKDCFTYTEAEGIAGANALAEAKRAAARISLAMVDEMI